MSAISEFCYKCNDFYHSNNEYGLMWNDPDIEIVWPRIKGVYKDTASAEGYTLDGIISNLSNKDQKWLCISQRNIQ